MLLPELPPAAAPDKMHPAAPDKPVYLPSQPELELHKGAHIVRGAVTAHFLPAPPAAGGPAIESKAHGVQNGGFPAAGGAGDEEQRIRPQLGKVNFGLVQIGAESLHIQQNGGHDCFAPSCKSSCRRVSAKRASSSGVISVSQTSCKNRESTSVRETRRASAA